MRFGNMMETNPRKHLLYSLLNRLPPCTGHILFIYFSFLAVLVKPITKGSEPVFEPMFGFNVPKFVEMRSEGRSIFNKAVNLKQ